MTTFAIVLGIACLGLFVVQGWALIHLQAQGARIQQRIDAFGRPSPGVVAAPAPLFAPDFDLPALNGGRRTLASLLAPGKSGTMILGTVISMLGLPSPRTASTALANNRWSHSR